MSLAILGGNKSVKTGFEKYKWFDNRSVDLAKNIIESGNLSGFLAQQNESHFGGSHVVEFENNFSRIYKTRHSVSFNSWTSGLEASVQSLNLEFGSEVIVPAWTMSATVSSIVVNGLIPVLVDINLENYNVSITEIEQAITNKTQAVMAVDIFGYPSDAIKIKEICKKNSLALVIDAAQTPMARINQLRTTEIANVGGYSFNRHKHVQVGEGGMAVTNDLEIASRLRSVRNHGEITSDSKIKFKGVGHNYRLGEIEAALANLQIGELEKHVIYRRNIGEFLIEKLSAFSGILVPKIDTGIEHDFYILGIRLQPEILGVSKKMIYDALSAEGIPGLIETYSELHKVSAFAKFANHPLENIDILNSKEFIGLYLCGLQYTQRNLLEIVNAFEKVWSNLHLLRP